MIYISAQPDSYYFLWQLQLQLFNFNRLKIRPDQIHVLLGYNAQRGISPYFQSFIEKNKQAHFFLYPDTRKNRNYESSIRPHIISKHFKSNSWLCQETLFYHDSDIIFTELPDFDKMLKDDVWYGSNTGRYNDSSYIESRIGKNGFSKMANLLKIDSKSIKQNDENVAGAQYILKNVSVDFWKAVERSSEKMYNLLTRLNNQQPTKNSNIQAWCADM